MLRIKPIDWSEAALGGHHAIVAGSAQDGATCVACSTPRVGRGQVALQGSRMRQLGNGIVEESRQGSALRAEARVGPTNGAHVERAPMASPALLGPDAVVIERGYPGPYTDDDVVVLPGWVYCYPAVLWPGALDGTDNEDEFDAVVHNIGRSVHEFVPTPSSKVVVPPNAQDPATGRLLLAISSDGVTWVKTGLVVANHVGVPCLAVENGILYLFFNIARDGFYSFSSVADSPEEQMDAAGLKGHDLRPTPMAMAYTSDLLHWSYRLIGDHRNGIEYAADPLGPDPEDFLSANDPSVVAAHGTDPNDAWNLYFTLHKSTGYASHMASAGSLWPTVFDGAEWLYRNNGKPVFPTEANVALGDGAEDPTVLWIQSPTYGGYYQYYSGNVTDPTNLGTNWSARLNADGVTIVSSTTLEQRCGAPDRNTKKVAGLLMANGLEGTAANGDHAWYGFVQDNDDGNYLVRLELDEAGNVLTVDPCAPLMVVDKTYEYEHLKDPAVVKFGGCYVMVYSTSIPSILPPEEEEEAEEEAEQPSFTLNAPEIGDIISPDPQIHGTRLPVPLFHPPISWQRPIRPWWRPR